MAPERRACTLYLRKAVWTSRAASYSSLCSGSDRVSWARSRSTLLLEALMNSLQSAGDGSVDLSRGPSLSGDPPGLRLGLDDGVRGSLYRDLGKVEDINLYSFCMFSVGMCSCWIVHLWWISLDNTTVQQSIEITHNVYLLLPCPQFSSP